MTQLELEFNQIDLVEYNKELRSDFLADKNMQAHRLKIMEIICGLEKRKSIAFYKHLLLDGTIDLIQDGYMSDLRKVCEKLNQQIASLEEFEILKNPRGIVDFIIDLKDRIEAGKNISEDESRLLLIINDIDGAIKTSKSTGAPEDYIKQLEFYKNGAWALIYLSKEIY